MIHLAGAVCVQYGQWYVCTLYAYVAGFTGKLGPR